MILSDDVAVPLLTVKGEYKLSEQNIYFELKLICCLNEVVVCKLSNSKLVLKLCCIDTPKMLLLVIELLQNCASYFTVAEGSGVMFV